MNDKSSTPISGPRGGTGQGGVFELAAGAVGVVWMLAAGGYVLFGDPVVTVEAEVPRILRIAALSLAVFLPAALLWFAALAARGSRMLREEGDALRAEVMALRAQLSGAQQPAKTDMALVRRLDDIAAVLKRTETAVLTAGSIRLHGAGQPAAESPVPVQAKAAEAQAPLPLEGAEPQAPAPLAKADFIRAVNFPETAEDAEGFAALRRALKDRPSALLIQASQDVLTLLSQDGIYMDDLRPEPARPELWRQFAKGERGRQVAALGGIRDRSSLALAAGRMKQDPIFRDATHHFLRRFDRMMVEYEATASDPEIQALAETRTARAFMLLGRVAGIFD